MATILLEVALDVTQEGDIKEGGRNQKQEGASKDKDGKESRECEGRGDDSVSPEVFGEVVPFALVVLLGHVNSVQRQSVDGLTGSVRQEYTFPALECEENKEGDAVTAFRGLPNVIKETEVIV